MKKILIIVLIFLLGIALLFLNSKPVDNDNLVSVSLAEVTHSVFYTPLYVAIENGYFKDNGIHLDLVLTSGADKVSAAVLSNSVSVGFAGLESTIYVYENGEEDYLVSFAGLTKRDGQFIVAREKMDDFSLEDLKGKEVLAGRTGGMPVLNFYNALEHEGIDPRSININESIDFASLSGTFISGVGDYVNLFEPNAFKLEKEGLGYVVGSVGLLSGEMPYTVFYARKSFIDNNPDIISKFNDSINKALDYVEHHSNKEVAQVIAKQFPDNTIDELEVIIGRYRDNDSWLSNTTISYDSFKNLEDLMMKNHLLNDYIPFKDLVMNINE